MDDNTNVYVADTYSHTIRKITSAGVVTTMAGLAGISGTNDGAGSIARFYMPFGVTVDNNSNVFVGDTFNHTIRKITPAGVVTTLVGSAVFSAPRMGPVIWHGLITLAVWLWTTAIIFMLRITTTH